MDRKYDVTGLISRSGRDEDIGYLFFMGHRKPKGNAINEACLSQWYPASFEVNGIMYKTAEQFMMAEKAKLFGDRSAWEKIIESNTPAEAKSLGRKVSGYEDGIWLQHRFATVCAGNFAKFSQNIELRDYLLSTNKAVLVEASAKDKIWGIGLDLKDKNLRDPSKWKGLNLLGFALMVVRDKLREEIETVAPNAKKLRAIVSFGNPKTEEWELVTEFDVLPHVNPDLAQLTKLDVVVKKGYEVTLPNSDIIEVRTIWEPESNYFSLQVLQGKASLVSVMCDRISNIIFYTLIRGMVCIQFFE